MELKKIAILGAGAVGCYVLWGLAQKPGIEVCLVAEGARRERLRTEGLTINGQVYRPAVCTPDEAHGVDLLIVTVKYNALAAALEDIRRVVGEHTTVISLMNGVNTEDIIGEVIGDEKIVHSLIKVASERKGSSVRFDPEATVGVIYGEKDPARGDERVRALNALFDGSGVRHRATDVILAEIWSKFRLNISNNQPQAMVGCGVGAYTDSEHMAFLRKALAEEVNRVAAAKGVDIAAAASAKGSKVQPAARYSTLQDLDAHRHTEVDLFAGAMVKMGRELGIPVPYNEFAYHMIKALEEKNDGRFDY